ncbi:MAG TPA: ROK family protein [Candidatus Saccharimonas sp.]|nr:ROK family protein [Candidatus Saccharimonas sp.]
MITAVDVGGTKTLVAQFGDDGLPANEVRFLTPPTAAGFIQLLLAHLDELAPTKAIAIGVPGIVDENGVLLRCGNLNWKNVALKQLLQERYNVPTYVENDAKLAALAEVNQLKTVPRLGLYLTVSTGIGGGLIVDGKLHPAFRNNEPGHMQLQFEGTWQQWQHFASGSAFVQHFGKQVHEFERQKEWKDVAERLSRGLLTLIPTLQPEVIIFGGSVGNYFEHYNDFVLEKLQRLAPYTVIPRLIKAHHPNEAVLYGCYRHANTYSRRVA